MSDLTRGEEPLGNLGGNRDRTAHSARVTRRHNIGLVVRTVLAHGPCARAEVAEVTALSSGAVTKLTAALIDAGVLTELTDVPPTQAAGRPRVPVDLNSSARAVASINIGSGVTTVGLLDLRGRVLSRQEVSHGRRRLPESVIAQAAATTAELISTGADTRHVIGAGASMGGWIDADAGFVVEHPALGWHDVDVREPLRRALGLPVIFDDHVKALALAETWFGPPAPETEPGPTTLVHLYIAGVVGAAIVVAGEVLRGHHSRAGAITHFPLHGVRAAECTCGKHNCLQATVSDVAIQELARRRGVIAPHGTIADLYASNGSAGARRLLRDRARWTAQAVAGIVELINPGTITLSGSVLDDPEFVDHVRAAAHELLRGEVDLAARIRPTAIRHDARLIQSAALVLDAYYRDPCAYEPRLG